MIESRKDEIDKKLQETEWRDSTAIQYLSLRHSILDIRLEYLYINNLNNTEVKVEILYRVNVNKTVNCSNKSTNLNDMIKLIKVDNKYLFNRIE